MSMVPSAVKEVKGPDTLIQGQNTRHLGYNTTKILSYVSFWYKKPQDDNSS